MKKTKVAILNSHPIQYFVPLYRQLSSYEDIDLEVFYFSDSSVRGAHDPGFGRSIKWDLDLLSGYKYQFVGSHYNALSPAGFFSLPSTSAVAAVWRGNYDVIVLHGYQFMAYLAVLFASKLQGATVLLRADTHSLQQRHKNQSRFKRWLKARLLSVFDGMLTIGTANHEFYLAMGVASRKLHLAPFVVDNNRFANAARMSDVERSKFRKDLGLDPDKPVGIFLSKMIPGKRPEMVICAAAKIVHEGIELQLIMAGTGEMEAELKVLANEHPELRVVFPGFVNQQEVPKYFGASDFLLFPAENEAWGLVVNEAMAAGLPVVVGREVGCVSDLVHNGKNGYSIDAGSIEELVAAMRQLATSELLRTRMSEEGLRIINSWGYEQCCAGYRRAFGLSVEPSLRSS